MLKGKASAHAEDFKNAGESKGQKIKLSRIFLKYHARLFQAMAMQLRETLNASHSRMCTHWSLTNRRPEELQCRQQWLFLESAAFGETDEVWPHWLTDS